MSIDPVALLSLIAGPAGATAAMACATWWIVRRLQRCEMRHRACEAEVHRLTLTLALVYGMVRQIEGAPEKLPSFDELIRDRREHATS